MLGEGDSSKENKCNKQLAKETSLKTNITQICSTNDKMHPLCSNCGRKINDTGAKKGSGKNVFLTKN